MLDKPAWHSVLPFSDMYTKQLIVKPHVHSPLISDVGYPEPGRVLDLGYPVPKSLPVFSRILPPVGKCHNSKTIAAFV